MTHIIIIRLLALTALAWPIAHAQNPPAGGVAADNISVEHPWARATAATGTTGAAYLMLLAHGTGDRLTGASTPVAGSAELHQTTSENGIMRMRPARDGIALPPDQAVTLAPGGLHVMLTDLRHALNLGDVFPLTLTFERAAPVTVQVSVQPAGAAAATDHSAHNGHAGMNAKP